MAAANTTAAIIAATTAIDEDALVVVVAAAAARGTLMLGELTTIRSVHRGDTITHHHQISKSVSPYQRSPKIVSCAPRRWILILTRGRGVLIATYFPAI